MVPPEEFRKNVAIVVVNAEGLILAAERSDVPGAWQLPQGGIDEGEDEETAMFRELEEEIGTREVDILERLPEVIRYDWPESLYDRGYRGQEQTYFLVRLRPTARIDLTTHTKQEFSQIAWMNAEEFLKLVRGFKADAYRTAVSRFRVLLPGSIA